MNPLIDIKRQRISIDHSSKAKTFVNEEFTIRALDNNVTNIVITKHKFLPNLRVFDSDGEELPVIGNDITLDIMKRQLLTAIDDEITTLQEMIDKMAKKEIYIIWIKLPPSKRMERFQYKVINFEYDAKKEHKQKREQKTNYRRNANHSVFYTIKKPEDYDFKNKPTISWTDNNDNFQTYHDWNIKNDSPMYVTETAYTLSVTIKPKIVKSMSISYSFKPTKTIISFPISAITLLSITALSLILLSHCEFVKICFLNVGQPATLLGSRIQLSIGITAASLVLPNLVRNENVRNDYKFYFYIPIGLGIFSFF